MNKLNALFIGNCQCFGIVYFLNKCLEFKNTFNVKQYANWEMIENKDSIPIKDIQSADLFIFQPLPEIHGCYSTDPTVKNSIGSFVKETCTKLSFPYVYSSAMWPLCQAAKSQNRWFGWNSIHKLKEQGLSKNDIMYLYRSNQIDWEYSNRFEESIKILKEKESITDIKISDYIVNNQNNLLFLIPQHPTSVIYIHLANQILKKLNMNLIDIDQYTDINEVGFSDSTYNCNFGRFPIHLSTIMHYNINRIPDTDADSFYESRILDYFEYNKDMEIPNNNKKFDDR